MLTLYHHPFCPFSRAIRLALGEYGLAVDLVEERVWERRMDFLVINPAGTLPVLFHGDGTPPVCGSRAIVEYVDEVLAGAAGGRRLMPQNPFERAETRRLLDWFDHKLYEEVSAYLLHERMYKRFMTPEQGGGSPDSTAIRAARSNIKYHLRYIGKLAERRNWLAGDELSHADLAAAAHLSCIDYLGEVPCDAFEPARHWYARIKSRPAFRPLLNEQIAGMAPALSYGDLDF